MYLGGGQQIGLEPDGMKDRIGSKARRQIGRSRGGVVNGGKAAPDLAGGVEIDGAGAQFILPVAV